VERIGTYNNSKEDMNKWQETVNENRHARVLDLAQDRRQLASYKSLVNRFEPTTDMEKEIQMVLIKHNATEETAESMVLYIIRYF